MIFRYPASSFACILIFSVAIAISTSSAQDDEDSRYLDCNQQIECGNWSFGFPFWGTSRPNFCGLPEFNLICDDNRFPTISISGLTYRILDINNSSQILTLLQTDYARDLCPTHPQNVTEVDNLFDFTDDTQFLNLYYDCTPPAAFGLQLPDSLESVVCLSNPSRWGYFVRTESIVGGYRSTIRSWLGQCSNRVRVPVNGTAVGSLEKDPMPARLTETIDQGFGMRWTANDSLCASCRTSGGQCGFSDTTRSFACFRVDQPYGEEGVPPATTPTAHPVDTDVSKRRILYSIISGVLSFLIISLAIFLILQRMKTKAKKDAKEKDMAFRLYDSEKGTKEFGEDDKKDIDVPFFDLKCIQCATDFFCISNKLGQGGFGPVYKGKFPGGQEMAVKRLSSSSTQGLEEFKNEVVLIAKLQHRNLVRLLGFCVEGSEKMLLYEYMPNKSLDFFIFDQSRSVLLNWEVRFNIIMGIARGMLYLHRDSRLTIVHRDLKTSNVLLDEEMNPKISDFGLARIVAAKQTEVDTVRVVGTYGYMSPEYALDGKFSTKSDVFSFGIVVLEILMGRKNTGFYKYEDGISLSSHVWRKWREGNAMEVMDQSLLETCDANEFTRCVIVALLCVQENPRDRPTMADVVFMLGCDASSLPHPKEPAFSVRSHGQSYAAMATSFGTMEITTESQGR